MAGLEIEIKSYCEDREACIRRAVALGAVLSVKHGEWDRYFTHPCRDFGSTDEALRVRRSDGAFILTYKGPKLGGMSKTRIEEEAAVQDGDALEKILEHLGFRLFGEVRKERLLYRLGETELCFDRIEELGDFVELERRGTEREIVEKELFALAAELGLSRFETRSYLELLIERRRS